MGAYDNLDPAIAGLILGIDGRKQVDTFVAQETIEFGAPVFGYVGDDDKCWNVKRDTGIITLDADLVTANVITTTVTVDGVAQTPVATTFATDHDTTMANHKADLEAAISGLTVTLTDATNNRQFTLLKKGSNLIVASVVTLGASQAGITITYSNGQVFLGVAGFEQVSAFVNERGSYFQYDPVNVGTYGKIWVLSSVVISSHTDAYVIWEITNQTKFTNVASGNYDIKARFRSTNTAAGLVLLEVRGQQTDATP